MDFQPSDALNSLALLRESVRRDDWAKAQSIAAGIPRHRLPSTPEGLSEYLTNLNETLVMAKVSRANTMASLVRVKAAARFHATAEQTPCGRQNSAVSTHF